MAWWNPADDVKTVGNFVSHEKGPLGAVDRFFAHPFSFGGGSGSKGGGGKKAASKPKAPASQPMSGPQYTAYLMGLDPTNPSQHHTAFQTYMAWKTAHDKFGFQGSLDQYVAQQQQSRQLARQQSGIQQVPGQIMNWWTQAMGPLLQQMQAGEKKYGLSPQRQDIINAQMSEQMALPGIDALLNALNTNTQTRQTADTANQRALAAGIYPDSSFLANQANTAALTGGSMPGGGLAGLNLPGVTGQSLAPGQQNAAVTGNPYTTQPPTP